LHSVEAHQPILLVEGKHKILVTIHNSRLTRSEPNHLGRRVRQGLARSPV
jgi:hypothetical protein